jgi:serine/threonine-protein kinase RsbW
MGDDTLQTLQFDVPSSLEEIPQATRRVFDFFSALDLNESDRFDLRLSFEEILINAMKHGNGYRREVPVRVTLSYRGRELKIAVQDQGKGFDLGRLKDPTMCDNIEAYSGRGVYLVKHLMDRLDYGPEGNTVEITKRLKN